MDKMLKSQEQSEQLQAQKLEAIMGIDNLVKNILLRGKVAKWAAVAASVIGISVTAMPAGAINRVYFCNEDGYFRLIYAETEGGGFVCYANAGDTGEVKFVRVGKFYSGNNAGYVDTDKGKVTFEKWTGYDFVDKGWGSVTVTRVVIY